MIFNEIKCHVNTSLGLVGGMHPCIPPVFAPALDTPLLDQPRKTLKCERILTLNLLKTIKFRTKNATKQRFRNVLRH